MPRLVLDLNDEFSKALDELVNDPNQKSENKADVVRRAAATYKYLKDKETKDGRKIVLTDENGKPMENLELP